MIIVSKENKDFLTVDDIFGTENDSQDTNVNSFEENSENTENFSFGNSDVTNSDIPNEAVEQNSGYSSQFGELEDLVDNSTNTEDSTVSQNQNKPSSKAPVVIIAVVAILVVASIALGVYFLFFNNNSNSIKSGAWVPVTIDETTKEIVEPEDETVNQYYKFTDTDMTVYYSNGYAANEQTYKVTYKDYSLTINDGQELTFNYMISGNFIQGKTLTLTIPGYDDQPMTFKWIPNAKKSELTGPEFTKNDKIIGYWKFEMPGNIIYKEFTEDGVTNEYATFQGTCQKYSQMYNFDGENLITLSPGSSDMSGEIKPGTEEKNEVKIDGDKLTLYMSGIPYEFTKSSKEEYEEFKEASISGTYEYPTIDYSQYEIPTETTTDATESVKVPVTEEVAE